MQLLTITDICRRTRYSRWTVWRHRRKYDDFPQPIITSSRPRWLAEDIDEWLLRHREGH